jgi:putative membrane protein
MPHQPLGGRGLQAERTELSWERSSFGFLVGGALVLLRPHGPLEVGRTLLALTAVLLALLVLWLGHRRAQRIKASHLISGRIVVAAPAAEVLLIGCATGVFSIAIVVTLMHSR